MSRWEREYEVLKVEALEMQQKYEYELTHSKKEKKEIRRTFMQVNEDSEQTKKLL